MKTKKVVVKKKTVVRKKKEQPVVEQVVAPVAIVEQKKELKVGCMVNFVGGAVRLLDGVGIFVRQSERYFEVSEISDDSLTVNYEYWKVMIHKVQVVNIL